MTKIHHMYSFHIHYTDPDGFDEVAQYNWYDTKKRFDCDEFVYWVTQTMEYIDWLFDDCNIWWYGESYFEYRG